MNKERPAWSAPGIPVAVVLIAVTVALSILLVVRDQRPHDDQRRCSALWPVLGFVAIILALCFVAFLFGGLTPVSPNEARVLVLFGRYDGTVREQGLHWVNPLTERKISVRVRNFETSRLKVNDHDDSLIEIAAVVVWKVTDTAGAVRGRRLRAFRPRPGRVCAPQPRHDPPVRQAHRRGRRPALEPGRDHRRARTEIQDRLRLVGVEVIEARISLPMPRDRQRDAPPPAGERRHRGADAGRRGRRGDGRDGPRATLREERRRARRGAQGPDGQQPARRPVLGHETQPVVNTGSLYA